MSKLPTVDELVRKWTNLYNQDTTGAKLGAVTVAVGEADV